MTDAMREARERVTEIAWAPGVRFMGEGARFAEGLDALLAARDAAWREAVARVRARATAKPSDSAIERVALGLVHSALDALLAAMEGK